jgi:hypothetical protein
MCGSYSYVIKKNRGDLYATKKIRVPKICLLSTPLPLDLGLIMEGKVQNSLMLNVLLFV